MQTCQKKKIVSIHKLTFDRGEGEPFLTGTMLQVTLMFLCHSKNDVISKIIIDLVIDYY